MPKLLYILRTAPCSNNPRLSGFTWFGLQEGHSKTHPTFDVERHLMESCEESSSSSMQRTSRSVPHRRQTVGRCHTGTMGAWETNGMGCNSARHLRTVSRQRHFHSSRNSYRQRSRSQEYTDIANTHMFIQVAIETGGPWNVEAIELIQEIGRRITLVNGEPRETEYLFQRISIAIQKGNHLAYQSTFQTEPNF